MNEYERTIEELAFICGILPEYYDISGRKHITSLETKKRILRAMKINTDSLEDIKRELEERKQKPFREFMEPVLALSESEQPAVITVYIPDEGYEGKMEFILVIEDEEGKKEEYILGEVDIYISGEYHIGLQKYIKVNLKIASVLKRGYYRIYVIYKRGNRSVIEKEGMLIIAPDSCYMDDRLLKGKTWGLAVQLYSLNSSRSWGVGDFRDLRDTIHWIWTLGGGFVGINPLHALSNRMPYGISPYYPISRIYKNFIYIDVESIPEIRESADALGIIHSNEFQRKLKELREAAFVNYEEVAKLKEDFLRIAFNLFYNKHYINNTERALRFKKFISSHGEDLENFCFFLYRSNIKNGDLKNGENDSPPEDLEKELLFYKFVQWIIDEQMEEISQYIKELGLSVGLYHDLAVSFDNGGFDAWYWRDIVAEGVSIGAPPDDFNPEGQIWGIPPLIPDGLRQTRYEIFIKTLRNNMKHCGALRIDHAASLFRLFWIPEGMSAKDGAYVIYPSKDLLKIIAFESVRNRTMIIVEDLGTITDEMRDGFRRYGMLTSKVFYFEKNYPDPSFKAPEDYPEMSVCMVTTHDLPTLYGYWSGHDLKIKRGLGIIKDDLGLERLFRSREDEKRHLILALKRSGIEAGISDDTVNSLPEMSNQLCMAIYKFLSLTPCKLLSVNIEDILGILDQQNIPGTNTGVYPNWMRRIPIKLEDLFTDSRFFEIASIFKETSRYGI